MNVWGTPAQLAAEYRERAAELREFADGEPMQLRGYYLHLARQYDRLADSVGLLEEPRRGGDEAH